MKHRLTFHAQATLCGAGLIVTLLLVGAAVPAQETQPAQGAQGDAQAQPAEQAQPAPPAEPVQPAEKPAPAEPQPREAPETLPPGSSCIDAGCHKALTEGPVVHPPVVQQGCELCHEPQGNRHAFKLSDKPPTLCFICHKDFRKKAHVHAPLEEEDGSCFVCHDPHVSKTKGLLKKPSAGSLCLMCHRDVASADDAYHKPADVEEGCAACHDPHASDHPHLVRGTTSQVCLTCHTDLRKAMRQAASVHGPVNASCTACHNPHRLLKGHGLAERGPALCLGCHEQFKDKAAAMAKHHDAPLEEHGCLTCHDAHTAPQKLLLQATSRQLCMHCHDKDQEIPGGGTLAALDLGEKQHLHGPLTRGDCAGCHEPHANQNFRFLQAPYPATFYAAYSEEAYGLCFRCHDEKLVEQPQTASATGFRNGEENLHYVHVHRQKGRTCTICHDVHASRDQKFIRKTVKFGQWELPIGYTPTATGGSCAVGCHQTMKYDRENPVSYNRVPTVPGQAGAAATAQPAAAGAEAGAP